MAESTTEKLKCAYCGEEITDNPTKKLGKVYCSEACAFEGSQAKGCDGRQVF